MHDNKRASVSSGLFWAFSERITAQLVTLSVTIVLARLLDPEHYAMIAVVSIFINIANTFVTSGFGNSLIQKKDADELDFSTTFVFSTGLSLLVYGVLFLVAPKISDFYNQEELTLVLRIMSLRIIIASVNSIQHAYVSKQMAFRKFFFSTLFGTVISGILGIYLAYLNFGVWALVVQYLTNTAVDTLVLFYTCGWYPSFHFSYQRMKSLYSYGWKLLVADLLGTIYEQLRAIFLSKGFKPTELSFYNQGQKYPALFLNNIEASMHKVLFQTLADSQDEKEKIKIITRTTVRISIFILSPLFLGLAACGNSLIKFLLTDKWLPSVPYMQIVCVLYLIHPIFSAHTRVLKAVGKSKTFMLLTIVRYIIGIVLLIGSMKIFNEPHVVIFSSLLTMLVVTVLCGYNSISVTDYSLKEQVIDVFPSVLCGTGMFFIVLMLEGISENLILLLFIQVISGTLIYLFFSYLFNKTIFLEVYYMVKFKIDSVRKCI